MKLKQFIPGSWAMIPAAAAIMLCAAATQAGTGAAPLTLNDCYRLALERSDSLKISIEDVKTAEARYDEALGEIFPNVHLIASERLQDNGNGSSSSLTSTSTPGSSNFSGRDRFQADVNVRQPIFQGFRDWYEIRALKSDTVAKGFTLERAKQLLYSDVGDVFYQILMYEGDLNENSGTIKIVDERIEELKHFIKLGRSRDAEILAAQSDLAAAVARREQLIGLWNASREVMAFLTGKPAATINLDEKRSLQELKLTLDALLVQSATRPDFLAAEQTVNFTSDEVKAAKGERWPAITLEGNSYPVEHPDSGHDWDLLIKADLPLFEGGSISARIRQKESAKRSADAQLSQIKREIERDVRTNYANFKASQAQTKALGDLVLDAKKSFESQRNDYKDGVVTNLDVLQAIAVMQDARVRLNDEKMGMQSDLVHLIVSTGMVPK